MIKEDFNENDVFYEYVVGIIIVVIGVVLVIFVLWVVCVGYFVMMILFFVLVWLVVDFVVVFNGLSVDKFVS